MNSKIWDPLRKKYLQITPEERVRQWFISVLKEGYKVPEHMMMSEVGIKYGNVMNPKEYRADILVYGRNLSNLMVVECKRPEVKLTKETILQAIRYDMVLGVKYLVITNGKKTFAFENKEGRYIAIANLPLYQDML